MKQKGFTLAEVLITIGIIGVVSTMTLPALIQNYQDKVYEAGIKKSVNTVSSAVQTYMAMEGVSNLKNSSFYHNRDGVVAFVDKYFKVVNNCGAKYNDKNKCFAASYSSLDKSKSGSLTDATKNYVVAIADGMTLAFSSSNRYVLDKVDMDNNLQPLPGGGSFEAQLGMIEKYQDIMYKMVKPVFHAFESPVYAAHPITTPTTPTPIPGVPEVLYVEVDINGVNGPNIAGRDLFSLSINSDGLVFDPTYDADKDSYKGWSESSVAPMPIGRILANGWKITY